MQRRLILGITIISLVVLAFPAAAAPPEDTEKLGRMIYQDWNMSFEATQSCMTCHHRTTGFADPRNAWDPFNSFVSTGDDGVSQGGRNAPSSAYAGFSPALHWDDAVGGYVGGMFWDGRATGLVLGDPLAEQAQGPPLNPVEMNMPDKETIIERVRDSAYADLFRQVFGPDALDDVDAAYDDFARAVAAYERSPDVSGFNSRFDNYYLHLGLPGGRYMLSAIETQGFEVFTGKGGCSSCHSAEPGPAGTPPLFTSHTYVNLGLPVNPALADNPTDFGLGGFLEVDYYSDDPLIGDPNYDLQDGKFKVPTLRNVVMSPPYGHNGVFPTLRKVIEFHNTRDVEDWGEPEVPENVTDAIGNLGLTAEEVDALIAFLHTLID